MSKELNIIVGIAKSYGYNVNLFVIHIDGDPFANIARVKNRQDHGGHGVPDNKVIERIPRILENVAKAVPLCDTVSFYDNTSSSRPFSRVAVLLTHRTLHRAQVLPDWAKNCIGTHYTGLKYFA